MRLQKLDSSRHNPGRLEKPDRFSLGSMVRGFFLPKGQPTEVFNASFWSC
jgi:hypothetical protein